MRRILTVLLVCAFLPRLAAAQGADGSACAALAGSPMLEAELFFGRNIGDVLGVSEADWERFVEQEVAPRFPDGLTIHDAAGHWRDSATGRLVKEPSKVLIILAPLDERTRGRLKEIAEAYKARFRQQAVGTVLRTVCVSF